MCSQADPTSLSYCTVQQELNTSLSMLSFNCERAIGQCSPGCTHQSLRECHARSAKFWMSANTQTLVLAPFHKFLVPYQGFFGFPSI